MAHWSYRQSRNRRHVLTRARLRALALATAVLWVLGTWGPTAYAVPGASGGGVPAPKMYGYAAGPVQQMGSAAGKAHYVPASATQAKSAVGSVKGHAAPTPDLASPAIGGRVGVSVGAVKRASGNLIAGHAVISVPASPAASSSPSVSPSPSPAVSPSPSPSLLPSAPPSPSASSSSTASTASVVRFDTGGGSDNASYGVAATYDTVAMADQTGRIAVTLTNTGTSTWSTAYGLGSQVFASGDTTGTGTALTTGVNVPLSGSVAPGGSITVESVTPAEDPSSYEICWDMVNASGAYFSAESGDEYCAGYTIEQYAPVINEQEPLPGTDVDSQSPQFTVSAVVPGGYPANPQLTYAFEIISGPTLSGATVEQSSGWVADNDSSWSPGTALTWGNTYYWVATVTDVASPTSEELSSATWTTPVSFVVGNAQPAIESSLGGTYQADDGNPIMSSDLGSTDYDGSGKTVDPRTTNVSTQATDASVATVGPPLSVVRTYNSLDPRTSQAFGAGWSSLLDMSLVPDSDGSGALILTLADGQQVRFAKNSAGGYAPPEDMYAVVTALSGGGFSVTDQASDTYDFTQASGSSWLISKVTDEMGISETFTYTAGVLTAMTNTTSGRALHVTWATPSGATYAHVASVSTDPVTAGSPGTALTWTYGYNDDLLTSVCPPGTTTACTTYSYITDGSHAATAVLNANPASYYRLNDSSGSAAAANQIPVNDLDTVNPPATEMNTTPGVAGPVPGVTATGFNGTSSWIPLDGAWCTTPGSESSCTQITDTDRLLTSTGALPSSEAVSIWFKTSTASGVLLGLAPRSTLPSGCSPNCPAGTPLLWIASNGDLDGYGGSSTTFSSTAAVDNGTWHQAVLIPGQALYLDGKEIATSSAISSTVTAQYALLGAGLVPRNSFDASWEYFNGSMADLAVYQNQLPSSGAVAAQYAAETIPSAELTTITTPAGRTKLAATYAAGSDRAVTLTDTNGGTWTYGNAVNTATSAAYDSAVMGSSPEDFWPLNDTAGPLAHDMVGGAATAAVPQPPATYTNVALGVPGPSGFANGTAASFSGSGSQISVPGGYFTGSGTAAESVELWFQTTSTSSQTLLSAGAGPTGGTPPALWLASGGCLAAEVLGTTLGGTEIGGGCLSKVVDDGSWHQAALTLGPITTTTASPGHPAVTSQTASLYLDGILIKSDQITALATPSVTGYVAYVGNGPDGDFTGAIADVSLYTDALPASDVSSHYNALTVSTATAKGLPSTVTAPILNTESYTVTDPVGKNATYVYAGGSLVAATDVLGGTAYYGYDDAARASTITNPDGYTTYTTYDAHNNVTSTTTCMAVNVCQTAYTSYYEDLSNPLDPRNDKPTDSRDARSSSPTDPTYDTVTTYTALGQVATATTPPATACPSGCETRYVYTQGTEAAVGGGTEPPGLLVSTTAPGGGVTSYEYDSAGDLMKVTDPLGMVTKYAYDNLGRVASQTQVSSTYPAGLTTSYTYNGQDEVLTETDPPITDRVTGAVHTEVTTHTYDPDGNVLTTTLSDATGGDPSRTTTDTYNSYDELATQADALGNTSSYTYDALGDRITQTNPARLTTVYTYDAAGNLLTTTLDGYTGNPSDPIAAENLVEESRAYDPVGRLASVTNVMGTQTDYTYYGDGQTASSYIVDPSSGTGMEDVTTYAYDAAGNQVSEAEPGGLVIDTAYNPDDQVTTRTVDPTGVDRVTAMGYDPDGDVTSESLTGGGVTQTQTMTYSTMGQELSQTVDDTSGNLTTSYVRDQRGLVISETDPQGNTTTIENDEAGRAVVETAPPCSPRPAVAEHLSPRTRSP
jgi:YD repeat-containing protein